MARHLALGSAGEAAVADWYQRRGLVVLERNWRCPDGELDLVLCDGGRDGARHGGRDVGRDPTSRGPCVVFCEVKTRTGARHGTGAEAVDQRKRRRLRKLAALWLAAHPSSARRDVRFDVASVDWNGRGFAISVIEAAF